jgi:transcriptional regulator with XRE-family HTH domain
MTLGDYIKSYREANQCSMDEFARRSGMSKAYVSILERNYNPSTQKPPVPSLETIMGVASVIGIDFDTLIASLDGGQKISLITKATPEADQLSKEKRELIEQIMTLPEEKIRLLLQVAKSIR